MIFIGQNKLIRELNLIVNDIINGENHNILLRAPSGYGKTSLAFRCAIAIDNPYRYYIPDNEETLSLDLSKRIQIIDEVHLIKSPEFLYPYLDDERFTFFLLSNETGSLKEPLRNRCINLIFEEYNEDEKRQIINQYSLGFLNQEEIEYILGLTLERCPREIKKIIERILIIFRNKGRSNNVNLLRSYVEDILNINPDGLTEQDRIYLEFLKDVEKASLNTLINSTGIDRETILREIEPLLLHKKLIRITSKGRCYNANNV